MRNISGVVLISALALLLTSVATAQRRERSQSVRVEITHLGYEPASFSLRKGIPARITFVRRTNDTCATEVLFPDYGISRPLPLDQAVVISLVPRSTGEFAFTCGMRMHRGRMIVK